MKGVQGIMMAIILGVLGGACNWLYVTKQARDYEKVKFVKIKEGRSLNLGDRFKTEHFEVLEIPRPSVGNLEKVAVPWTQREYLIGRPATKTYSEHEILLQKDLKTPGQNEFAEMLPHGQVARSVPVDSRTFVPERVNPGNMVSFVVPSFVEPQGNRNGGNSNIATQASTEVFGPFKILALGTRTGRKSVQQAVGQSSGAEHVITIGVKYSPTQAEPFEPQVTRMFELLRISSNKGVQVLVHSNEEDTKKKQGLLP